MPIKILPARLANQIAAGEVVERPASVVKELVENSLDSGATRIDIDIEKGGSKLIRVRDNGSGIDKDELSLALSRHATSKIHTLDDLEAIMSLGFRGEALASISSVSRLTLTSRTVAQPEAWAAYSEGRDMEVRLQPAAHPVGTTVEVLDLFFNTPARRKFLRTEKTEFTHIDELLKRIALSRFDVSINLKHNGKMIRQYRAANNQIQEEKRIAAVCGSAFVRHMLKVELEHQGLKLCGWITTPEGARQQSDLQYCYVNGRMMRDKLINHAIRQSYETSLRPDQFATYVLYIELDPHQVDVNVHPAKHEVRFHQARLVHDFIYQALTSALAESQHIDNPEINQAAFYQQPEAPSGEKITSVPGNQIPQSVLEAVDRTPAYPGKITTEKTTSKEGYVIGEKPVRSDWQAASRSASRPAAERQGSPSKSEVRAYQELMKTPDPEVEGTRRFSPQENGHFGSGKDQTLAVTPELAVADDGGPELHSMPLPDQLGKAISVIKGRYLLMTSNQGCMLISLARACWLKNRALLMPLKQSLKSQPLLVPLSIKVESKLLDAAVRSQPLMSRFGIDIKLRKPHSLMIMGVPQPLRQQNLQNLVPDLLSYASLSLRGAEDEQVQDLADWISDQVTVVKSDYTLSEAIQLIAELEQLFQEPLPFDDTCFVRPVDFTATIAALNS